MNQIASVQTSVIKIENEAGLHNNEAWQNAIRTRHRRVERDLWRLCRIKLTKQYWNGQNQSDYHLQLK